MALARSNEVEGAHLSRRLLQWLGIAARTLAERGNHEGAEQIARHLEEGIGGSRDPLWQSSALIGLGNAGLESSAPVILRAFHATDTSIREAAVLASSRVTGVEIERALDGVVSRDASDSVREAAGVALGLRTGPAALDLLSRLLWQDPSERVRTQAVGCLARAEGQPLDGRRLALQSAADQDPSDKVRAAARGALATLAEPH